MRYIWGAILYRGHSSWIWRDLWWCCSCWWIWLHCCESGD